jgi:protein SCO1/2
MKKSISNCCRLARISLLTAASLVCTTGLATEQHHHGHAQHAAAQTDDPHAAHRAMLQLPQPITSSSARIKLPDLELLDQEGRSVKFRSDLVQDRLVVIDFIYTSCGTVCPILSAVFAQLQEELGDALGEEVLLISISVDPGTDRPERLKAYAERYQAKPGWTFLTGERQTIDQLLSALGTYAFDLSEHPPSVLVGNADKGQWTRFNGFPKPQQIHQALAESRG